MSQPIRHYRPDRLRDLHAIATGQKAGQVSFAQVLDALLDLEAELHRRLGANNTETSSSRKRTQ